MNDYPDTAKFLTSEERFEVHRRLEEDRSSLDDAFDMQYVWAAVLDWKIWVHCIIFLGILTPLYCISLFLPTIVKDLGYANNMAQLMTVPPYVVACVACISVGLAGDKTKQRGIYCIACLVLAIIGSAMLLASTNNGGKYAGTFFLASGIYPNVPAYVAWNGNNIGGSTKRSVGIAMQVGMQA
jgi:cyanate permease